MFFEAIMNVIFRVEIHVEVEYFSAFFFSEIANLSPNIVFSVFFIVLKRTVLFVFFIVCVSS